MNNLTLGLYGSAFFHFPPLWSHDMAALCPSSALKLLTWVAAFSQAFFLFFLKKTFIIYTQVLLFRGKIFSAFRLFRCSIATRALEGVLMPL